MVHVRLVHTRLVHTRLVHTRLVHTRLVHVRLVHVLRRWELDAKTSEKYRSNVIVQECSFLDFDKNCELERFGYQIFYEKFARHMGQESPPLAIHEARQIVWNL
jgi:hypothetical protein